MNAIAFSKLPTVSVPVNDNPTLISLAITLPLRPPVPLHHSLHALDRNFLARPIDARNMAIPMLARGMRTRLSILMVPRTDRVNSRARAIQREMCPCC